MLVLIDKENNANAEHYDVIIARGKSTTTK